MGLQLSPVVAGGIGSSAPNDATFITQTPSSGLTAEQALSLLSTGLMVVTTTTGVVSSVAAPTGTVVGTSDTQTLTNKTLTSPKINENVALTATATELNYSVGVTSAIQTQLNTKITASSTDTLTNKTLTAPKFASGGFIADANGNELIIFTTTGSAVNEITFANGATGVNPQFSASGETNVGIDFQAKGSGVYRLLGTSTQAAQLRLYEDTDDGSNYTAFKVGTQTGDVTYTLPTAVGGAGTFLYDSAGNGTLSWATPSGFSYGASISGTTADGCTITLSNSSNDAAAALKLIAGNTQANQPALANLQIGTSGNVQGLLIQGTGGTTAGAVGTGLVHATLWADVNSSANKVLAIGNGAAYAETAYFNADGTLTQSLTSTSVDAHTINLPNSPTAGKSGINITYTNTTANEVVGITVNAGTGTRVSGVLVKGTYSAAAGAGAFVAWNNTSGGSQTAINVGNGTSFLSNWQIASDGSITSVARATTASIWDLTGTVSAGNNMNIINFLNATCTTGVWQNKGFISVAWGNSGGNATSVAQTTAMNSFTHQFQKSGNVTDAYSTFVITRGVTYNSGGNTLTSSGAILKLVSTVTATAGTVADTSYALDIAHAAYKASTTTYACRIVSDNAASSGLPGAIDMSSFSVDEPLFKVVADAITVAGAVAGQICIDVGGTKQYVTYHADGT